ncbi:uncharacterized protein LOC128253153 [Drosophila gunungcola]|uniref:Extensin n=1 Tax=Drosophila gunungcola TaxID=103775 RepID=A0A9Q0BNS6_9MUSC|nr:uncharacterized protein LOC128253153 [Drosophila gunungcola]KAI8038269.1 hypothetical protein M5D96_008959 [Drosophila gunungcola]
MLHSTSRSLTLSLLAMAFALPKMSTSAQKEGGSNTIAAPGEPLYYMMADRGPLVAPNEPLKRTNRSLLKWWDDLFPRNNNCCNNNVLYPPTPVSNAAAVANNCNGLQLEDLDPFKQLKLFKKLPDLFPSPTPCGQCAGGCGQSPQPQNSYVAPPSSSYGADGYGGLPNGGYVSPNPEYNGPGDGNAGYVAPPAPSYEASAPPAPSYEASAPPAPSYEASAPPAPSYEAPAPPAPNYDNTPAPLAPSYDPPAPSYTQPGSTSEVYGKTPEYSQAAQPNYVGSPPAQIVYQPIIYLSTPLPSKPATQVEYISQAVPSPQPAAVYESPPPSAPPTPAYATPSCQTPIRLSLMDQPFRVAPELFEEYNYRLALGPQYVL